ncbi:MAG: hypothetical protein ACOC1K_03000 [Nanoarchaeota archaeon]
MNELDLRLKFKADTGVYPLYYDRDPKNYRDGNPKSEYGFWLEEMLSSNPSLLREKYKRETGLYGFETILYTRKARMVISSKGYRRKRDVLNAVYVYWLEDLICNRARFRL